VGQFLILRFFARSCGPVRGGFYPGFLSHLPPNDRFGVSQNRICQRSFERTFSNLGKSFLTLDFKYVSMSS